MSKSVGLDKIVEHLKCEKERFLKAGNSGLFCDSENCLKTACTILFAIDEINKIKKN